MRRDAVGSGVIVVHGCAGTIEHDADEAADGPFECQAASVDDIYARIGTVAQIVLGAIRIDPADVERQQRIARDLHRGQAHGLRRGRRARAGAHRKRCAGRRESEQRRGREDRGGSGTS